MKIRMLLTAFAILCAGLVSAQTVSGELKLDPAVRYGVLDNGLTYYIRQNNYPENQAEFYIAQKVGSMQEEEEQRGLAHFLEHMCFNGTENFPGNRIIKYLEGIGVKFGENLNAYTSYDETVYNISGVPTTQPGALDSCLLILHDWSNALLLHDEEIDKERGVIHEEWRISNNAFLRMYNRALPTLMSGCRYGERMPIGLMSVVDYFKPQVLRDYYHRWYRPDLQGILVVGDINVDEMEQKIKTLFGKIKLPQHAEPRTYEQVPDNDQPISVSECDKEQTVTVVRVMYKHDLCPDNQKNRLSYLQQLVQSSMAVTMLNERLNELANKADAPFAGAACEDGIFLMAKTKGALSTSVVPKDGLFDEAVKTVMAEVFRADRYGFTASETERARANALSALESSYQNKDKRTSQGMVNEYVQHFLSGEPAMSVEDKYAVLKKIYQEVTAGQISAYFQSLIPDNNKNLVIYTVSPEKEGVQKPDENHVLQLVFDAQKTDLGAYKDEVSNRPLIASLPAPGRIVKERDDKFGFKEWTLSNGVKVLYKKTDFNASQVQMYAYSPGGSGYYSGKDMVQLNFFGDVIGVSGMGDFRQTELIKLLAGKQVSLSPSLSSRSESLSGASSPRDLRTLFELIYLSFQRPYKDEEAVASMLNQTREVLRNKQADPKHAFGDSVSVALYGHHPRLVFVKPETIDEVNYDRILDIYEERFADASDFTFIFSGNLNEDSLRVYSEEYLAVLPALYRKEKPVDTKMYKLKGDRELTYYEKMETSQCQSLTTWYGPIKYNLKNALVCDILGQILNIRYMETIREEMGAAYSLGTSCRISMNSADKPEYMLQTFAPLKPELNEQALQEMDNELKRISEQGISDVYLDKVKEFMIKNIREQIKTDALWIQALATYKNYKVDVMTGYEDAVRSVSSDDIRKMAARVLKDRNKVIVKLLAED